MSTMMKEHKEEFSKNDKLLIEEFTARMSQVFNDKYGKLRQDIQQLRKSRSSRDEYKQRGYDQFERNQKHDVDIKETSQQRSEEDKKELLQVMQYVRNQLNRTNTTLPSIDTQHQEPVTTVSELEDAEPDSTASIQEDQPKVTSPIFHKDDQPVQNVIIPFKQVMVAEETPREPQTACRMGQLIVFDQCDFQKTFFGQTVLRSTPFEKKDSSDEPTCPTFLVLSISTRNQFEAETNSELQVTDSATQCGKTRDDPIEERDGPRLKSEYGDHCARPPDQENHVRRFTLILDQVVLRDDQNLLILGHMGLVRPPECGRRFLVSHEEPALLSNISCVLRVFTACEEHGGRSRTTWAS
ncbi:hypothetical protein Bca52824_011327 [Brassica carinata]|uniref:Uncharacterized protein n=1 Tax=Brassica carinata TaxID=52824 RepID=A0A8X8B8E1_BRACI|nr:hypothetical protein Bca52824_011327 [Brassica carinata]